jgi:hypothetical protein
VAAIYPEVPSEPNSAVGELQHTDIDAVKRENVRLRELVVQLSSLVVKYVMADASNARKAADLCATAPIWEAWPRLPTSTRCPAAK